MAQTQEPEYHVVIRPDTDPETGDPCLAFDVSTVREFTSFGYTINVDLRNTVLYSVGSRFPPWGVRNRARLAPLSESPYRRMARTR